MVVLLSALALPATSLAQVPGTRMPVANKQVLSANPFLLMAEWANVEYERKASETFTFGASFSLRLVNIGWSF